MLAKDIKNGSILNYNGVPCAVESITVQSPSARGAATFYKIVPATDHQAEGRYHSPRR